MNTNLETCLLLEKIFWKIVRTGLPYTNYMNSREASGIMEDLTVYQENIFNKLSDEEQDEVYDYADKLGF